jgi:hypothetical protein
MTESLPMNPAKLLTCLDACKCVLLVLSLAAPLSNAAPRIERWQTTSGARVFFVENHALPIVDIQVDFAAGTAYENEAQAGVASLDARTARARRGRDGRDADCQPDGRSSVHS